jgi:hypothetical protein
MVNDFQFLYCKETTYSAAFPPKISELLFWVNERYRLEVEAEERDR